MNNSIIILNKAGNFELIDQPVLSYLKNILRRLDFKINEIKDVDIDGITIILKSNYFFLNTSKLNKIIKIHAKSKNKISVFIKNCAKSTHSYHNLYGILKKDGILILDNSLIKANERSSITETIDNVLKNESIFCYPIKDFYSINNLSDLSEVEKMLKKSINRYWLNKGVRINDIDSVTISKNATLSKGAIIKSGTSILGKTFIGPNCGIGPYSVIVDSIIEENSRCMFSVIENSTINKNSTVGPYAHLRMNSVVGESNRIGNFVEIKNSTLGNKTNVAHLTYIGDTICGNEVNWGCGSVTVNYDGKNKFKTIIGDKVFIGCNTNLIAPIVVESKSFIAAGSTITNDVNKGGFAIARAKQITKDDYAKKYKFKEEGVKCMMQVIKCKDYEEASKVASEIFIEAIKQNPSITLGLATGSTPIGTYKNLIKAYNEGKISFKDVKTYNLDEYVGLPLEHPETYYNFMHTNLFDHVDILEENVHVPFADKNNMEESCKKYSEMLNNTTVNIQLLGIGANGHIGFNEPGTSFDQETFIIELTQKTREDNKRFFNSIDEVPTHAITMGIKNIMNAEKVVLVATGENKKEAVKKLLSKEITTSFPASVLHNHKDVIIIIDEAAAKLL